MPLTPAKKTGLPSMNELATNELAAAKEHLTTEEYEEILAFGANW